MAGFLTAAATATTVGITVWAHHLGPHQRNGGNTAYGLAVVGWALVVASALWACTVLGMAVARRLDLDGDTVRIEARLAVGVAVAIVVAVAAVGVWWVGMARGATWFLAGTRPGTQPSALTVQLVVIEGWLVLAAAVALYGATRVTRSLRAA